MSAIRDPSWVLLILSGIGCTHVNTPWDCSSSCACFFSPRVHLPERDMDGALAPCEEVQKFSARVSRACLLTLGESRAGSTSYCRQEQS